MIVSDEVRLARSRMMPPTVRWLCKGGAWVLGSRADFSAPYKTDSDWDILVPLAEWNSVVGALPLDKVTPTSMGGYRFEVEHKGMCLEIDVWPGDVGKFLTMPHVLHAWHPSTNTLISRTPLA